MLALDGQNVNTAGTGGISELEQLLKQQTFTRSDFSSNLPKIEHVFSFNFGCFLNCLYFIKWLKKVLSKRIFKKLI